MSIFHKMIVLLSLLMVACRTPAINLPTSTALPEAQIARYPAPSDYYGIHGFNKIPAYNPNSDNPLQIDLRSTNLKELDLSSSEADLFHAVFDSKTTWPPADKMPGDFNWQKMMEIGKAPGLGIRALHEQGITGKGVNIAIIDQPLIIDHIEYPDRIRLYEEINVLPDTPAQMHGPGVASIAVGKTVGVAPDANVYYIAAWTFDPRDPDQNITYKYNVQALRHLVEINQGLPGNQKIRAVSISIGLRASRGDYDDFISAIQEAKTAGIVVITGDMYQTYGWNYLGMGRDPLSDPDDFQSYRPAVFWEKSFYDEGFSQDTLLIPMESRTTASPTGKEDYVFYAPGGMSWTMPYLAGMYALAVQVKPEITPEEFWETALRTGRTTHIQYDGRDHEFGVILDPQALIQDLKGK